MTTQFADVDGRPISYVRRGRGQPLLLIQGMSGHHAMWGEDFSRLQPPRHRRQRTRR